MSTNGNIEKPLTFRMFDSEATIVLELTNRGDQTLKSVEILTIFLNDVETAGGGPSKSHIRFGTIESIPPRGMAILSPITWVDGKPVDSDREHLACLKGIEGRVKPYVMNISWQDAQDKTQFQRIPVGH